MEDLGKLIVAKGLKKLPKVKKIAQSGHTDLGPNHDTGPAFSAKACLMVAGSITSSVNQGRQAGPVSSRLLWMFMVVTQKSFAVLFPGSFFLIKRWIDRLELFLFEFPRLENFETDLLLLSRLFA